jgi:hypothetical protein
MNTQKKFANVKKKKNFLKWTKKKNIVDKKILNN